MSCMRSFFLRCILPKTEKEKNNNNKTLDLYLSLSMHFRRINQMQFQSGLCFKQSKWSYNAGVVPETIALLL